MTPLSVLTLVKNREPHLIQLVEGLARSTMPPAELIVVDMSAVPVTVPQTSFPVRVLRLETDDLPLAAARNRAACAAQAPHLLFLDVDCIPMAQCLATMARALDEQDALLCADIRYLGPGDAAPGWREETLLLRGMRHPVRSFPDRGVRREDNPGLFWSLAFAITQARFTALGGFDEAFVGYGAEDTDFGFRAAEAGLPLLFVGGAIACHQHHALWDPPLQHFDAIVRNARLFHARWGRWPMEGWLAAFAEMGLVQWDGDALERVRGPNDRERARCRTG